MQPVISDTWDCGQASSSFQLETGGGRRGPELDAASVLQLSGRLPPPPMKRSHLDISAGAAPCHVVPVAGQLRPDGEVLGSMAKLVAMALPDDDLKKFVAGVNQIKKNSENAIVAFGSICTGSGLGDLALHELASALARANTDLNPADFVCNFVCELDRKKAAWLLSLDVAPLVFKDATMMGMEETHDWRSSSSQVIPSVQVLFLGFSCKDLSQMNQKVNLATEYVIDTLRLFMKDPDAQCFNPTQWKEPLRGSTAPTLIGAMQYIRRHLPEFILFENVPSVTKITPDLEVLFQKMGYAFFVSETMDPTNFGLPNSRPRIYFGARRCSSLSATRPSAYAAEVRATISRLAAAFKEQTPMSMQTFVFEDPETYYAALPLAPWSEEPEDSGEKWQADHARAFGGLGRSRPTDSELADFARGSPSSAMSRWFLAQPRRSQEVAYFASCCIPRDGPDCHADLSQGIGRAHITSAACADREVRLHTFTARTVAWLVRARRLLSGAERLAMHGLGPSIVQRAQERGTEQFSDSFLSDLAGNSFSATCFMCAFVAGCQP